MAAAILLAASEQIKFHSAQTSARPPASIDCVILSEGPLMQSFIAHPAAQFASQRKHERTSLLSSRSFEL